MDILKDLCIIHSNVLKKSLKGFGKNWMIIFTGFVYTLINIVIFGILNQLFVGVLNLLIGFIAAIVSSCLISNYLYLIFNVIKYNKITLANFKEGFSVYLRKVYGVFFIAWILSFLLSGLGKYSIVVNILILIIFNPLPETIYQKYYSPFESITYTFEFMKENWFNWLLPNIIFGLVLYKVSGMVFTNVFVTHIGYNFDLSLKGMIVYLIGQILFSFMMIYRGYLFDVLSNSTRRKRLYMRNLYD